MAESTLSLTLEKYRIAVGDYLGFGRDDALWSANEISQVDEYVMSGLRQFYNPPLVPGRARPHEWTFLRPTLELSILADTTEYTLPDAFGGFLGPLHFSSEDQAYGPVNLTTIHEILRRRSVPTDTTGPPCVAATRPIANDGTGQRTELLIWPTPDAAYTLTGPYQIIPDHISNEAHYPWGGQQHAETILASCLAVAERMDERPERTKREYFIERLMASIAVDERQAGEYVGTPYGSWSCGNRGGIESLRSAYMPPLTYNGVLYDGDS